MVIVSVMPQNTDILHRLFVRVQGVLKFLFGHLNVYIGIHICVSVCITTCIPSCTWCQSMEWTGSILWIHNPVQSSRVVLDSFFSG